MKKIRKTRSLLLASVVLLASLTLTFLAFLSSRASLREREGGLFREEAEHFVLNITSQLDRYKTLLRTGQGYLASKGSVYRNEWDHYVDTLNLPKNAPGMQGMGFITHLFGAKRHTLDARSSYDMITYFKRVDGEPVAPAIDVSSRPEWAEALKRARDTNLPAMTGPTILLDGKEPEMALVLPVYRITTPNQYEQVSQETVKGWIFCAIDPVRMVSVIDSRFSKHEIDLEIYDGEEVRRDRLLYAKVGVSTASPAQQGSLLTQTLPLLYGGHTWTIRLSARPAFAPLIDHTAPTMILGSGLVASLLLYSLLLSLISTRIRAELIAVEMTRELSLKDRAMASTLDGIFITDPMKPDNPIIYANAGFERITGHSAKEVLGHKICFFQTTPENKASCSELCNAMGEGLAHQVVLQGHRSDGTISWYELSVSPVPEEDGKITHFVGIQHDITKQRHLEQMKDDFVSVVSHELRTPLTSIRGSLGLIAGGVTGPVPEKTKALVEIAINNCNRLERLINDILDIEKIESGRVKMELKPMEIVPLIEAAIRENLGLASEFGVQFVLEGLTDRAMALVEGDRFIQVITNLLSNASKFSPKGGRVVLSVSRSDKALRIAVSDQGPGISEEFQPHIFEKFAQGTTKKSRKFASTGLGLNICKAIVDGFGGKIGFQTGSSGTTFYVDLPEYVGDQGLPVKESPRQASKNNLKIPLT